MADTTISLLPSASAAANAVVPADSADGSVTNKVTLASIAALGGGAPASHASTHATTGADVLTPASIGAVATTDSRLTNSRVPTSHNSSHFSAGTDPIAPSDIGAAATGHTHALSAISDAGTAASKNVPASGNASSVQVVLGSDTRLTNARDPNSHASSHRCTGADAVSPVVATPSSMSGSQNDYAPGVADVVYLSSSAAVNITGMAASAVDGFAVLLMNVNASGGNKITLKHESSSSSAANRFHAASGGDVVLYADGGSALLVYHAAASRWRIL